MLNIAGELWMVYARSNVPPVEGHTGTPNITEIQARNFHYTAVFTHFLAYEALNVPNLRPPPTFIIFDAVPIEIAFAYGNDAINRIPADARPAIIRPFEFGFDIGYFGAVTF